MQNVSLPFVHTARRYYRSNVSVRTVERAVWLYVEAVCEMVQTVAFRGSKSRNKVSVGEPSEGSFVSFSHLSVCTL